MSHDQHHHHASEPLPFDQETFNEKMDDIAQRNLTNPLDLFNAMFNASRDLVDEKRQVTPTSQPHMNHMNHGSMDHSGHASMDHANHGGDHGSHSMATYFYIGYDDVQMVLKNWIVDDLPSLLGTCLVLVAIVLVAEWLRLWRENFQFAMIQKLQSRSSSVASNRDESDAMFNTSKYATEPTTRPIAQSWRAGLTNRDHIILALTYTLQQTISLVLMLVFMTFNLYLCAAVVLGHGLGYYFFAWRRIIPVAGLAMTELGMCH